MISVKKEKTRTRNNYQHASSGYVREVSFNILVTAKNQGIRHLTDLISVNRLTCKLDYLEP